jgi:hypothetical protein
MPADRLADAGKSAMTLSRIEPIGDWISVTVAEMAPEAQKRAVAAFAREKLEEAQATNRAALGRVPPHRTFVDGRPGAPLETVNVKGGRITFEFELVGEILAWILSTLRARSPVASGRYRDSHRLFADGREIAAVAGAGIVPPAEEYSFVNLTPYARKVEVGRTKSGRAFLLQVPNQIYQRVATDAARRFGNLAKIRFTYRSPIVPSGGRRSRATRSPAITVTTR